jgi:Pyridine nucleotide-disulphide oxidoreductase
VRLEDDHEIAARAVLLATGAEYRRLPVDGLADYEGLSVFYAAGPPEARLCGAARVGVVGGGNSAGQAAVWLARGGALVTLLHRRADLREAMSDYLVRELERYGVAVRDRSEIEALHGDEGHLDAVTLTSGDRVPVSFLFLFLGARPCTEWLEDTVLRDDNGFILTGTDAHAEHLLETSLPGIFAAGDVRSGSTKRCATAVGEGAMAVRGYWLLVRNEAVVGLDVGTSAVKAVAVGIDGGVVARHEIGWSGSGRRRVQVGDGPLAARIRTVEDLGSEIFVHVAVEHRGDSVPLIAKMAPPFDGEPDDTVGLQIIGTTHVFGEDGSRIASSRGTLRAPGAVSRS